MQYLNELSLLAIYFFAMVLISKYEKEDEKMALIIVEEKVSSKKVSLYTREEAKEWLMRINPKVPQKELITEAMPQLIDKYAVGWMRIINY
jgi:hypothetical protein